MGSGGGHVRCISRHAMDYLWVDVAKLSPVVCCLLSTGCRRQDSAFPRKNEQAAPKGGKVDHNTVLNLSMTGPTVSQGAIIFEGYDFTDI